MRNRNYNTTSTRILLYEMATPRKVSHKKKAEQKEVFEEFPGWSKQVDNTVDIAKLQHQSVSGSQTTPSLPVNLADQNDISIQSENSADSGDKSSNAEEALEELITEEAGKLPSQSSTSEHVSTYEDFSSIRKDISCFSELQSFVGANAVSLTVKRISSSVFSVYDLIPYFHILFFTL